MESNSFYNYTRDDLSYIKNSTIERASTGIHFESASTMIDSNVFRHNTNAIFADGGSQPTVAYNTFTDNVRPIYIFIRIGLMVIFMVTATQTIRRIT